MAFYFIRMKTFYNSDRDFEDLVVHFEIKCRHNSPLAMCSVKVQEDKVKGDEEQSERSEPTKTSKTS